MKHRHLSLALILALLLGTLCPAAMAEAMPWNLPALGGLEVSRALVRASGDGYEYFTYAPAVLEGEGILGSIELDLDNDGQDEYLSVVLEPDHAVTLNVHDRYEGDEWIHTAAADLYQASLICNIQANDVFLKKLNDNWVIFNENWLQENGTADGASWSFSAFGYDGTGFVHLTEAYVDGTDVYGTLEDWANDPSLTEYRPELPGIAAELKLYDFDIEGVYWGNPICDQDTSLTFVSRLLSVQDIAYSDIWEFTGASGSRLEGFRSIVVDGAQSNHVLPIEYCLYNNYPVESDESAFVPDYEYDAEPEFIIPDSDVRALTADELSIYDKDTLALIRNEILARYGYPFQKQKYRDYFESTSWYTRNEDFTYNMLTALEMDNIELIKKLEAK